MLDELKNGFSHPSLEEEVISYWKENDIFNKLLEHSSGRPEYVFYEGPPTANGKPGVHHIISRTLKDFACRYWTMRGYHVDRKAGWDTHGLPVEIEVEKKLDLHNKSDVEKYGIDKFNKKCRESVFTYLEDWNKITERIGYWLDLDNAYITCENYYIESVWHILADFHKRDLLYQGHKILPYCPRCETGLSSHEVAQGYQEVADPSVFVKVKLKGEDNRFFLVWTTTPWTLISNMALAVHPEADYVEVKYKDQNLILAEALANSILKEEFEIVKRYKGTELERWEYEPLFDYYKDTVDNGYFVTNADFVTLEDGTGIVHVAPAFGADDYTVGQKYDLTFLQAVTSTGLLPEEVTDFAGKFIKDADPLIINNLKQRGLLFKKEKFTHNYPFCWRCDTPLIYYARKSWYIRTTQFKDRLLENNRTINWYPPEIGSGRFGEWLENNVDWALSRERYWGTPLPIWIGEKTGKQVAIGSVEELKQKGENVPDDIDLHKPYVDDIRIYNEEDQEWMYRTPEVIDVWFDSGAMPFAQHHYPFGDTTKWEKSFPADFISEAVDQTRGWFYSLVAISTLYKDVAPFKNLIVCGFILDKDGKKMSKHIGNVVNPWEVLENYGADALRWYLVTVNQPWLPTRFDIEALAESQRKVLGTLRNTYSFFAIYANIDKLAERALKDDKSLAEFLNEKAGPQTEIDRWLLSRLNSVIKDTREKLDDYRLTTTYRKVGEFVVDELSNWYVRRSRRRFWGEGDDPDKFRAFSVLHEALVKIAQVLAPIMPFFTEKIYRELVPSGKESIHMTDFPDFDQDKIDEKLETRMSSVISIVSLARTARTKARLKIRQPLAEMIAVLPKHLHKTDLDDLKPVIAEEINIKDVRFSSDDAEIIELTAKPNFKLLGPKLGAKIKLAKTAIESLPDSDLREFRKSGKLSLALDGEDFQISDGEIELETQDREGYAVEADDGISVAVSTELSEDLVMEGYARELINKIQNMRKSADFNVTDRIKVAVKSTDPIDKTLDKFGEYIKTETLADEMARGEVKGEVTQDWDINGQPATITVSRT
ncbi:MAG: isoleucine--tRNA ligase [candidate division Zixibacteria bacterium]|nr:isoleucine--tRNA ligase [candidate division Zixibacteria bacterium]